MGRLDDMKTAIARGKAAKAAPAAAKPKKPPRRSTKTRDAAQGRLPDKSVFLVAYDAATRTWAGKLSMPGAAGDAREFHGQASGVFTLLAKLDQQYRSAEKADAEGRPVHQVPPAADAGGGGADRGPA